MAKGSSFFRKLNLAMLPSFAIFCKLTVFKCPQSITHPILFMLTLCQNVLCFLDHLFPVIWKQTVWTQCSDPLKQMLVVSQLPLSTSCSTVNCIYNTFSFLHNTVLTLASAKYGCCEWKCSKLLSVHLQLSMSAAFCHQLCLASLSVQRKNCVASHQLDQRTEKYLKPIISAD